MKVAVKYCISDDIPTCNNDDLGLKSFFSFNYFVIFNVFINNHKYANC